MKTENETLIDYLDQQLTPDEVIRVEDRIAHDAAWSSDLEFLKLAVETVRFNALDEKVSRARYAYNQISKSSERPARSVIRSMYKMSLRAAAVFIVLIGATLIYKYVSVNDQSVYKKQFLGYELNISRGKENLDPETEAYQDKNWQKVIALVNAEKIKTNKSCFMAGISEMQLNQFPKAIQNFEYILQSNANKGDSSFQDEAEYYISLAYLMNHEEDKAITMLDKIKRDKNHTYYPIASKLSFIDLKIIALKK